MTTLNFEAIRSQLPPLETVIRDAGVTLQKQGSRWFASCPFHEDSSPSFSIFPDGLRCGCPPCQWDGDVFEFVQRYFDLPDAAAAARWLCEEYHVTIPDTPAAPRRRAVKRTATPADATAPAEPKRKTRRGREIEHYDYTDTEWNHAFRVFRYELVWDDTGDPAPGKTFTQRRIMPDGSLARGMDGVTYWLYRMPAVASADTVWICEGERDVHALEACGVIATTDAGGCGSANKFVERGYPAMLAGKDVLIVPDTDKVGRERGALIAHALHGIASRVRIVPLPEGCKDVREYMEQRGGTVDSMLASAVEYSPVVDDNEPVENNTGSQHQAPESDSCSTGSSTTPRVSVNGHHRPDWRRNILVDRHQNPRPVVANVLTVLRHCPDWANVLWHNEFSQDTVARRPFPGAENISGEVIWTDRHDTLFVEWLNHQGIAVSREVAGQAVQAVAEEQKYHPVREFLQDVGSRWDGDPRIDNWLQEYLHVKCSHYTAAVGARWLISAVARIFEPGCKADCALILEGEQGAKKSTALRILGEPWFTDQIPDLGSKEASIQTRGVWIIEIAELDSMRRVEVGKVKAFMSCPSDRYRPPYGKRAVDYPRQCVFAGTVNHGTYLHDETGNRRFWPVECRDIDADGLYAVKEQLWAEAVVRYRDREPWWLDTPALIAEAEEEQRQRFDSDPWEDLVRKFLATRNDVSVIEVLDQCVKKLSKDWTQLDKNRVGRVLRSLRWIRYRYRDEDGEREWRYRRPSSALQENMPW